MISFTISLTSGYQKLESSGSFYWTLEGGTGIVWEDIGVINKVWKPSEWIRDWVIQLVGTMDGMFRQSSDRLR